MWAVHVGVTEQPVNGAQSVAVDRIIYHGRYRPKGLDYDIALMRLSTALVFNGNGCSLAQTFLLFLLRPPSEAPPPKVNSSGENGTTARIRRAGTDLRFYKCVGSAERDSEVLVSDRSC